MKGTRKQYNRRVRLNQVNPKPAKIDDAVMLRAEKHHAKVAALIAGAQGLLADFINGTSWGTEIALDVAIEMLTAARHERNLAMLAHREARA